MLVISGHWSGVSACLSITSGEPSERGEPGAGEQRVIRADQDSAVSSRDHNTDEKRLQQLLTSI